MITKENCLTEVNNRLADGGDLEAKAASWSVVHSFLADRGLREWRAQQDKAGIKLAGIEVVIGYLDFLLNSPIELQNVQECDATDDDSSTKS